MYAMYCVTWSKTETCSRNLELIISLNATNKILFSIFQQKIQCRNMNLWHIQGGGGGDIFPPFNWLKSRMRAPGAYAKISQRIWIKGNLENKNSNIAQLFIFRAKHFSKNNIFFCKIRIEGWRAFHLIPCPL